MTCNQHPFEAFVADQFRLFLECRFGRRYGRPERLDQPGRKGTAGKTPDFILRGRECGDVVIECKRFLGRDAGSEKRTERKLRDAIREAGYSLTEEHYFVFQEMNPVVPARGDSDYQTFKNELAKAFGGTERGGTYDSAFPLRFSLLRFPGVTGGPVITALHGKRETQKECLRFLHASEAKFENWLRSGNAHMKILLLLSIGQLPVGMVWFWMWFENRSRPLLTTHVYGVSFTNDGAVITGYWPKDCQASQLLFAASVPYAVNVREYMRP